MAYRVPFVDPRAHYQRYRSEIDGAIHECLRNGDLIYRDQLRRFEANLAAFVGDRPVAPERRVGYDPRPRARWLRLVTKTVFICASVWFPAREAWGYYQEAKPKPYGPLLGLYDVVSVERNGVVVPPLAGDSTRWRRIGTGSYGILVQLMNDSLRRYETTPDSSQPRLVLTRTRDSTRFDFSYVTLGDGQVELRGRHRGDSLHIVLRRAGPTAVQLTQRGFHWINESPYYR